ncbi:MAG: PKD domain-containing protein [Bacteroidota bacterium]
MKQLFPLFIALLCLQACKQQPIPEVNDGQVRFFVEADIAQNRIRKEAGVGNEFLHTYYERIEDELYVFHGSFGRPDCRDCAGSLGVQFRDLGSFLTPDDVHVDSLLEPGERLFFLRTGANTNRRKKVEFINESKGGDMPIYSWTFGDGNTSMDKDPVHFYEINDIDVVTVCLETQDVNGCATLVCNEVILRDSTCTVDFSHILDSTSSYVSFESNVTGKAPFDYEWTFGDGATATLANPGYFYTQPAQYEACLTIEDALGCRASLCKRIAADPQLCEHNFTYRVSNAAPGKDFYQYGRIEITWRNENGVLFSSSWFEQENASFSIINREAYQENPEGNPTYAFRARFSCDLWDEEGNKIRVENGLMEAAIAYP